MLDRLFMGVLRLTRLDSLYQMRRVSPLAQDGWFRSVRERAPVDREGNPIPWYSYPAIEFLRPRIRPDLTVFEYGCGNSTLWWANRAAQVHSIEHDGSWYERMSSRIPSNVTLRHVPLDPPDHYARALLEAGGKFDVVVIDGRERVECARVSADGLTEGGIVVFDNSDRPEYSEGYAALASRGFRRLDFVGMTPIAAIRVATSVFYRPGNCLDI